MTLPGKAVAAIAIGLALVLAGCSAGGQGARPPAASQGGQSSPTSTPLPSPSASPSLSPLPSPSAPPQQGEAPLPVPRQEVASAVLPGAVETLYVVGGFDSTRSSTRSVEAFRDSWTAGPDYPLPIDHAAAATLGSRIFVAGGFSNGQARAEVFQLSDAGGWQPAAPMHHARGGLALVSLGDRLYAIGGRTGIQVAAVEVFDPTLNSWTDVAGLPQPRDHVAGFAWLGRACVAGGRSPNTARVDCYDPNLNSWSRLPDLPAPTSGAGAVGLGDQVIVAGGEDSAESLLVDKIFRFHSGAWSEEPMLVPRHGIQLAVFRARAWACGGATVAGYRAVSDCTSLH